MGALAALPVAGVPNTAEPKVARNVYEVWFRGNGGNFTNMQIIASSVTLANGVAIFHLAGVPQPTYYFHDYIYVWLKEYGTVV